MADVPPPSVLGHKVFLRRAPLDPPLTLDFIEPRPVAHWVAVSHFLGSTPEGEVTHEDFSLTFIGGDGRVVAWTPVSDLREAVRSAEAYGVQPSDWEPVSVGTPDDPENPVDWGTEA